MGTIVIRGHLNSREYSRLYMRKYREMRAVVPVVPRKSRYPKQGTRPRPPEAFIPLPKGEQRHGHCVFCGLRSYETVCGFCKREIAA